MARRGGRRFRVVLCCEPLLDVVLELVQRRGGTVIRRQEDCGRWSRRELLQHVSQLTASREVLLIVSYVFCAQRHELTVSAVYVFVPSVGTRSGSGRRARPEPRAGPRGVLVVAVATGTAGGAAAFTDICA